MKHTLILTTAAIALASAAQAQDKQVNLLSWGGAYGNSHVQAYVKPFEAKTGIKVSVADADNPATPIKGQVEAGNVTADVASVEYADAVRLCDEGLLEEIDKDIGNAGGIQPVEPGRRRAAMKIVWKSRSTMLARSTTYPMNRNSGTAVSTSFAMTE